MDSGKSEREDIDVWFRDGGPYKKTGVRVEHPQIFIGSGTRRDRIGNQYIRGTARVKYF